MSLSMDDDEMGGPDYSDYEYQTAQLQVTVEKSNETAGSPNAQVLHEYEPLLGSGGLDNNEVAELVALETIAHVEPEDETADQDVGTNAEVRGVVGVNLPSSTDAAVAGAGQAITGEVVASSGIDSANIGADGFVNTDDRKLQLFSSLTTLPFDDETNGPGGGAGIPVFHNVRNFRELTGRGPVLDSSDDMAAYLALNVGDTIMDVSGVVRQHMVWDISTVSDAGRRFSVPRS